MDRKSEIVSVREQIHLEYGAAKCVYRQFKHEKPVKNIAGNGHP